MLLACYSLVSYVSVVRHFLTGISSIYYNPFYRGMEFFSGTIIANIVMGTNGRRHAGWRVLVPILIAEVAVVYLSITVLVRLSVGIGDYMAYTVVLTPLFGAVLFTQGLIRPGERYGRVGKAIAIIASLTYEFYLSQLFSNDITRQAARQFGIQGNAEKMIVAFGVCMFFAALLHYMVTVPAKRLYESFSVKGVDGHMEG